MPGAFTLTFEAVVGLSVPAEMPWGRSIPVLKFVDASAGRHEFAMQSGDTITVTSMKPSFELALSSGE